MSTSFLARLTAFLPCVYLCVATYTVWWVSDTSKTDPVVMVYALFVVITTFFVSAMVQLSTQRSIARLQRQIERLENDRAKQ